MSLRVLTTGEAFVIRLSFKEPERSDLQGKHGRRGSGDKLASIVWRGFMELPGGERETGKPGLDSRGLPGFNVRDAVTLADLLRTIGAFFDDRTGVLFGAVIVVKIGIAYPQEADEEDGREDGGEEEMSMHG
jgi:hypothetical protein